MRFLMDVCVGQSLGEWLRSQGHDVAFVRDVDPKMADDEILSWGRRDQRIVVTLDKDFGHLIFRAGRAHSGLVRLPNIKIAQRMDIMKKVLERHSDALKAGAIITVSQTRIRVRR